VTSQLKVADPCAPVESVAVTPSSALGVPLKVQVELLKDRLCVLRRRGGPTRQGTSTFQVKVAVPEAEVLSVAVTCAVNVPGVELVVPLITPVEELMDSPVGRPVADQVNVVMLESESVADMVRLTDVLGGVNWLPGLVTVTRLWIVQVKVVEPTAPVVSCTVTCTVNGLPVVVVGVPLITPVVALTVSPVGSPVAE
jgi:hypothetical protein